MAQKVVPPVLMTTGEMHGPIKNQISMEGGARFYGKGGLESSVEYMKSFMAFLRIELHSEAFYKLLCEMKLIFMINYMRLKFL